MKTELSPAAQAVYKAYYSTDGDSSGPAITAALRAVADQMRYTDSLGLTGFGGYIQAQDQILAIATELEAQP